MRLLLVTAACAAAFALPVLADQTAPSAPAVGDAPAATTPTTTAVAPATTPTKTDEGVICKMKEVTGTRFSKKVCTTKAQRDEEAAQGRAMLGSTHPDANRPPGS